MTTTREALPAPAGRLVRLRRSLTPAEWSRVGGMVGFIALLHIVGWGVLLLLVVPSHYQVGTGLFGVGTGLTAYTLGLRHAFDADHIAAIDNTPASSWPRGGGRCRWASGSRWATPPSWWR